MSAYDAVTTIIDTESDNARIHLMRCWTCGAIVEQDSTDDHDAWHEGQQNEMRALADGVARADAALGHAEVLDHAHETDAAGACRDPRCGYLIDLHGPDPVGPPSEDPVVVETCAGCQQPLDVRQEHLAIEARLEVQDPPGHVVAIGSAYSIGYHLEHAPTTEGVTAQIAGPQPGHVEVLARQADGTLIRWTARYHHAGLSEAFGQLCILGEAWHREVAPPVPDGAAS